MSRLLRGEQNTQIRTDEQTLSTQIYRYPPRSPGPRTPLGVTGDSAPYPVPGGTPCGTAGPRREGLM